LFERLHLRVRAGGRFAFLYRIAVAEASPNAMEYWAMQYLNFVEILSPVSLRERIAANLEAATGKYN